MYIILVYDINLEENGGQKVLRKVFKTCKKYLIHIQNSVLLFLFLHFLFGAVWIYIKKVDTQSNYLLQ